MGIDTGFFKLLASHPHYGRAFVETLPRNPDVLIFDISHQERRSCNDRLWIDFEKRALSHCKRALSVANTVLFCGDFPRYVPRAKQPESQRRIAKAMETIEPLSASELKEECITKRTCALPDMKRALITPALKTFFPAVYANFILSGVTLDPKCSPVKTIIVDGVMDHYDQWEGASTMEPRCFIKRSSEGGTTREFPTPPIGESDLRWVRWLKDFASATEDSPLFGLHAGNRRPVVVLDMNDGDMLPVALVNLANFITLAANGAGDGNFPFELYVHQGKNCLWEDFTPRYRDLKQSQERRACKNPSHMIDVVHLWEIIAQYLGMELGIRNPVEVFCALLLLGGTDYVKSIDDKGVMSSGAAPFRSLGPTSIFRLFHENERARNEFSSQILVSEDSSRIMLEFGPLEKRRLTFIDESKMLRFVKRHYQEKLKGYGLAPSAGDLVESFERIREADLRRVAKLHQRKCIKDGETTTSKRRAQSVVVTSELTLSEHNAIAVIRRLFFHLDMIMNSWQGSPQFVDISCEREPSRGLSLRGYEINPDSGLVELARRVYTGER